MPKVKPKKVTLSKAKAKAWKQFSLYIRTRDARKGCVTCGRVYPIKQMQAGHWLPGRHPSVLFDERNCHAQCMQDNVYFKGQPIRYYHFMEKKYGLEVMKELEELDTQIIKRTPQDYLDLEELYRNKLSKLGV